MEPKLQRRVQRYGWDLAAVDYESSWRVQLACAQARLMACAAFAAGPVALAWSRFDDEVRARVRDRYVAAIRPWRHGRGYRIPGEFVIVAAAVPSG